MKNFLAAMSLSVSSALAYAAVQPPSAQAEIDWSTFSVTLTDLAPQDNYAAELTLLRQKSHVYASTGSQPTIDAMMNGIESAADWVSSISSPSPGATASASADSLYVESYGNPAASNLLDSFAYAGLGREAWFELTPQSAARFSVSAAYSVNADVAYDSLASIGLHLRAMSVDGGNDRWDDDNFLSNTLVLSTLTLNPLTDSRILSVYMDNPSNESIWLNMSATLWVYAPPVAAVPEPHSYAMLLAGLGLVGLVVRRRI